MPPRWRPWTRVSAAVACAFHYRVVIALRNVPAHARTTDTAQRVLGRCCAEVELTNLRDRPLEDDREYFVFAWCWHPQLIKPEKLLYIPEPDIRSSESTENAVQRGLHYIVRVRVVAFQNLELPGDEPPNDGDNADDDEQDQAEDRGGWDDDDRYYPTPRRNSDCDSDSTDPRHRNSHPYCDYPSDRDGGQQDDLCLALKVGEVLCSLKAGQFHPASMPTPHTTPTPAASSSSTLRPTEHAHDLGTPDGGLRSLELLLNHAQSPPKGFIGYFIGEAPVLLQAGGFVVPAPSSPGGEDWWATLAENELLTPTLLRVRPVNALTPATEANVRGPGSQLEADGHTPIEEGHNSVARWEWTSAEHIPSLHGFIEAIRLPL